MAQTRTQKTKGKSTSKKTQTVSVVDVDQNQLDLAEIQLPPEIATDPRKASFFYFFFDRMSQTYGNYRGSAIRAGFSEAYADRISVFKPEWISGFIRNQNFVQLAETHLTEVLMLPNVSQAMGAFGPVFATEVVKVEKTYKNGKTRLVNQKIKIPVMKPDTSVIKVKNEAAKLVLPAHDPDRYGKKDGPKISFSYNVKEVRQRYQPSTP